MNQKIILHTACRGDVLLEMRGQTLLFRANGQQKELSRNCYPSFDAAISTNDTIYAVYATPSATYLARLFQNTVDIAQIRVPTEARNFHLLLHGTIPLLFYTVTKKARTLFYFSFLTAEGKMVFIDACSNPDSPFAVCVDAETQDILITYVATDGGILTRRFLWSEKTLGEAMRTGGNMGNGKYPSVVFDGGLHIAYLVKEGGGNAIAYCPPNGESCLIYRDCAGRVRPVLHHEAEGLWVSFLQEQTVFHITLRDFKVEKQAVTPQTRPVWCKYPPNDPAGCTEEHMIFFDEQSGATQAQAQSNGEMRRRKEGRVLQEEILQFAGIREAKPDNLEMEKLKIRIKFLENKLAELEKRLLPQQREEA